MSINHDKDIELKNKGLAGLYIQPAIKRYYLEKHTSISEKCQAHKKVSEAGQFGTIATLALNCHNIWLRKCRLFWCNHLLQMSYFCYWYLSEGEADLVAHSALAICSWLRFYEPYASCNDTLSPPLVSGAATPVPLQPERPLIQHSLMGLSATLQIFPPAISALHSHFPVFPSALERPNFISPHISHRWVMSLYFRGGGRDHQYWKVWQISLPDHTHPGMKISLTFPGVTFRCW